MVITFDAIIEIIHWLKDLLLRTVVNFPNLSTIFSKGSNSNVWTGLDQRNWLFTAEYIRISHPKISQITKYK